MECCARGLRPVPLPPATPIGARGAKASASGRDEVCSLAGDARGNQRWDGEYLIDRIAANPRIELMKSTEVVALDGDAGGLSSVTWRERATGAETSAPVRNLFLYIGADPASESLDSCGVIRDENGFVATRRGRPDD